MSQSHKGLILSAFLACSLGLPSSFADPQESAQRIVTIGGAATEIVFALGRGDDVVAVDLSSTYPASVRNLPQVGYVRSISPEGVLSMDPDLIIATGALGPPAARKMMERLSVPTLWLPDPVQVSDLRQSITEVAGELGIPEEGEALFETINAQLSVADLRAQTWGEQKPSVLFLLTPPTASTAGTAGGSDTRSATLIRLAGGKNAAQSFSGFQPVSLEGIIEMNPDIILCGLSSGHGASPESVEALQKNPALAAITAVQRDAVYGVPLDDISFGPRLGEAVLRWNGILADEVSQSQSTSVASSGR